MKEPLAPNHSATLGQEIRKRMALILCILVVVPAAFVTYSLITPKMYRATVTVAPAMPNGGLGGLSAALEPFSGIAALAGLTEGRNLTSDEAIAVLRSRAFTERFLASSGAMNEILMSRFDGQEEERYKIYDYFDSRVRFVSENRKTGLYTITIEWFDPEIAASWANALVHNLNAEMQSRALNDAERNLKYLNHEIDSAEQVAIRDAINRLIEAQVKQRMLASVTAEYAFRVIDPAVPPSAREHMYPNRFYFALAGTFLAMCLVAGIVVVGRGTRQTNVGSRTHSIAD